MLRASLLSLFVLFFAVSPLSAGAQSLATSDPVTIRLSPEYPRPYEQVTITVESSFLNVVTSTITISANGAVIEEGSRNATIKLGGPGTKTDISVSVSAAEGTYVSKKTIRPAELSLVVEPVSTSHAFYDGAQLVPSEGRLRLIALTDLRSAPGTRIPNESISYTWRLGDKVLLNDSGFGKNVLTATAPPRYRDAKISVTAETRDASVVAYATTVISPVDPIVRIYPKDPLRGVSFSTATADALSLGGAEATFRAIPYFFAVSPAISWSLNGEVSGAAPDITVRSSGGAGTAALSVTAQDAEASATDSAALKFTSTTKSGILGF